MIKYVILVSSVLSVGLGTALKSRVVNGTDVKDGEFPFMVSLRSYNDDHLCGCTILSESWVLTAAHCVAQRAPGAVSIEYGVTEVNPNGPNIVQVSKFFVHENYNKDTFENDIALLQLARPLSFGVKVKPVKLVTDSVAANTTSVLLGWGRKETGGTNQIRMQKVELLTVSREECSKTHVNTIFESNVCAGIPTGGKGQCTGDSGGPLLVSGSQYGIVSWSVKPCAMAPYPGVFASVSYFIGWIEKTSGLKLKSK